MTGDLNSPPPATEHSGTSTLSLRNGVLPVIIHRGPEGFGWSGGGFYVVSRRVRRQDVSGPLSVYLSALTYVSALCTVLFTKVYF